MNIENERTQIKNPTFQKTINGTTYVVRLHFNESADEQWKIKSSGFCETKSANRRFLRENDEKVLDKLFLAARRGKISVQLWLSGRGYTRFAFLLIF